MGKTPTKTTKTTPKVQTEVNDSKAVEANTVKASKREYSPTDAIECVSVTAGKLFMIGRKTKNVYVWADYGDTQEVEYQDLKAEKYNRMSKYIYSPLILISDEELLDTPDFAQVKEVYARCLSAEEIEDIFNLDTMSFRRTIMNLPVGIKNAIKSIAAEKISNGSFDSIQKIKILDEILKTDLFHLCVDEG